MSTDRVRAPGASGGYALPPSVALTAQLRGEIADEGVPVALEASLTGLRGVRFIALAKNSSAPRLRLFDDRMDVRVLWRRTRAYTDIEHVELIALRRKTAGSPRRAVLEFRWRGGLTTFVASFAHPGCGRVVLAFLDRHGVPLGPAARARLDTVARTRRARCHAGRGGEFGGAGFARDAASGAVTDGTVRVSPTAGGAGSSG